MSAAAGRLMPSERICLKRTRPHLIRSLDVATVLPRLRKQNHFTPAEETRILADPRRRERVVQFLDAMETKSSATFKAFCDILSDENPHLYLTLSEWDKEDNSGPLACNASVDDEWDAINKNRSYIVTQVDGANVAGLLKGNYLTAEQRQMITTDTVRERRTEALLDILETKPGAYNAFIEAVGEVYPHVYLELTGQGGDDEDW